MRFERAASSDAIDATICSGIVLSSVAIGAPLTPSNLAIQPMGISQRDERRNCSSHVEPAASLRGSHAPDSLGKGRFEARSCACACMAMAHIRHTAGQPFVHAGSGPCSGLRTCAASETVIDSVKSCVGSDTRKHCIRSPRTHLNERSRTRQGLACGAPAMLDIAWPLRPKSRVLAWLIRPVPHSTST